MDIVRSSGAPQPANATSETFGIADDYKCDQPMAPSPISQFYAGKSILITGATGFIGKVLIEKLLYSCPNIKNIYLLIRSSKGKSPRDRMIDMIEEKPFVVRLKRAFILSKLIPIESDLALKKLGLSVDSQTQLIDKISVVFHVAASVKFEAPLEVNMRHNVVATRELLEFACKFKKLECFVHVSTAYSNCQLLHIDERVYAMQVPDDPMKLEVTKQMIDNRPNTYTYTKAMAENVAQQYADRVNIAIVRPSIVMSALKEPAEGWVDTINGPVGLSVLGALGILQKIKVNSEVVFDLIPVDIVSNALISIAWAISRRRNDFQLTTTCDTNQRPSDTEQSREKQSATSEKRLQQQPAVAAVAYKSEQSKILQSITSNNIRDGRNTINRHHRIVPKMVDPSAANGRPCNLAVDHLEDNNNTSKGQQAVPDGRVCVFNMTTGSENPCSFYQYFYTGRQEACEKPSVKALRPLLNIPKQKGMNPIQYWIHKIFSHLFFAYIMDLLLSLMGKKTMVVKAVNRMHHANEMFDYFCSNQWNFKTDNVKQLRHLQCDSDKETFNCDVRQIDWNSYSRLGWLGCRRYILRESDDSIAFAKKRYLAVCCMYYLVKLLTLVFSFYSASCFIESKTLLWMLMTPIAGIVHLL